MSDTFAFRGARMKIVSTLRVATSLKMIFYFTYESRGTLKSFSLFISDRTIPKLNRKHSDKF